MADFGKDTEGRYDQHSDQPMSMEDIDRLLSDDELDRMLKDDDVASFIDSQNFQELLNAEDIDDILKAYRKSVPEADRREEKAPAFSVQPPAEAAPEQPRPAPAAASQPKAAPASFHPGSTQKPAAPKYQERFPSFTVELNRSEIQELAKKQADQKAAVEAQSAPQHRVDKPVEQIPPPQPAAAPVQEEKADKPAYDAVFGIPIPQEHRPAAAEPVQKTPETLERPAEQQPVPLKKVEPTVQTPVSETDELDIDALIREIEEEAKAFGFDSLFSETESKPAGEKASAEPEQTPQAVKEPVVDQPREEVKPVLKPEPVPVREEKTAEPEKEESEPVKNIRVTGATLEIDVPKGPAAGSEASFELHIPKEAMAIPEPESAEEMEEELAEIEKQEQAEEKKLPPLKIDPEELPSNKVKADGKKHHYALLGVVMTLLALIGVAAVLYFGFGVARDVFTQSETKQEFNRRVYPLVVVDVPAFESVDRLDSRVVVEAGIWNFLLNEENKDKYEQDDFGTMTVPAVDIEVYIYQIFGNDVEIVHQQLSDPDFTVIYDEENQLYYIPEVPQVLPYAPSVQSVTHTGDDYTVEVGYVLPGPFWNVEENVESGDISKTMIYHYTRTSDGDYWIRSVENGDVNLNTVSSTSEMQTESDSLSSEAAGESAPESTSSTESGTSSTASSEAA